MPYQDLPSSESGPQGQYPSTENLVDPPPVRNGAHNLIIAAAIVLLVGTALVHTYRSSTTASSRSISNLTSEIDAAMQATKRCCLRVSKSDALAMPKAARRQAETPLENRGEAHSGERGDSRMAKARGPESSGCDPQIRTNALYVRPQRRS